MNWSKINRDCITKLFKNWDNNVLYCKMNGYTFITLDGHVGYFVPDSKLRVTLSGDEIKKPFDNFEDITKPENELHPTNVYYKATINNRCNSLLRIFKGVDGERHFRVYINIKYLKPIENESDDSLKFYQIRRSVCETPDVRTVLIVLHGKPVMIVCPVRIYEEYEFDKL